MFTFDMTLRLKKKVFKLAKKDKVLAIVFKKKVKEIISRDVSGLDAYKNLRSPMNLYKRIHLTDSFVLLFHVDKKNLHILFMDIVHHDKAYS